MGKAEKEEGWIWREVAFDMEFPISARVTIGVTRGSTGCAVGRTRSLVLEFLSSLVLWREEPANRVPFLVLIGFAGRFRQFGIR